ncbi:hypothetical protein ACHAXT_013263 [Thalassiosira profunda]
MADKRVTMIKPVVGRVRSPSCALPEDDFVYGIESKLDKEGAGEVVQSWAQSKPSEPPSSLQSYPATNREALKQGCLTSKAQREFSKKNPVMKHNPKRSKKAEKPEVDRQPITSIYQESGSSQPPQAFGIQSKRNKVSMTELLKCPSADDEQDYPDLSGKRLKGRLPPAKPTKSSLIVAKSRELLEEEMAKRKSVEEFKLTRFKNVPARVKC